MVVWVSDGGFSDEAVITVNLTNEPSLDAGGDGLLDEVEAKNNPMNRTISTHPAHAIGRLRRRFHSATLSPVIRFQESKVLPPALPEPMALLTPPRSAWIGSTLPACPLRLGQSASGHRWKLTPEKWSLEL